MKVTKLLKVLSSETKTRIIMRLYNVDCEDSVNDLCKELELNQPNLSKHFIDLRKVGIVDFKKQGKEINYSLNESFLKKCGWLLDAIKENVTSSKINYSMCRAHN